MHHTNMLTNSIPRRNSSRFLPFLSVLLALLVPSFARAQQQPQLDALAAETAGKIHKSAKVLVIDFADPRGKSSPLGVELADEFAAALRKTSRGLVVIDRADYARAAAEDLVSPAARAEEKNARCYCRQLGAEFVVGGTVDAASDKLQLSVRVTQFKDWKKIFETQASLPLTPDLQALRSKPANLAPAPAPAPPPADGKNSWVSLDHPLSPGDLPPARNSRPTRNSVPACIYCPAAQFSDAALHAKLEGTVALTVLIDTEGRPANIWISQGSPCGLNRQAIETVKQWKFKPAEDANGNPIAARTNVEVTFHLY